MVQAARLKKHGAPLEIDSIELPEPSEGEVRVELAFGGVNPVDRYGAEGRVAPNGPLPRTLGGEASGTLNGTPVLVFGEGLGSARDGLWAEAAVVPITTIFELPDGVDLQHAAAMGVAGLTAWNVVHGLAHVTSDDRALVLGASGGVGSIIVSLVAAAGASVCGQTSSEDKVSLVREQGADQVIVAGADQLADALSDFQPTVVFDPLGGGFVAPAVEAITARGRYVTYGTSAGAETTFNLQTLYRKAASVLGYGGMQLQQHERRDDLERALVALRDGELKVPIDAVLPLEQVNEAFDRITQRRVRGNLLLALGA
jgi:NADPH2:quinone reductase